MLLHLEIPVNIGCTIIVSKDKHVSWAIILPDNTTILIDPNDELTEYCDGDDIIPFYSNTKIREPKIYTFGLFKIYQGCYHTKSYVYINTDHGGIFFPMLVDDYHKIVKELKPVLTLTRKGDILKPYEVLVNCLTN